MTDERTALSEDGAEDALDAAIGWFADDTPPKDDGSDAQRKAQAKARRQANRANRSQFDQNRTIAPDGDLESYTRDSIGRYFADRYKGSAYASIEDAIPALTDIYMDLMTVDSTKNPFVLFLDKVSRIPAIRLRDEDVQALNDMYASYKLDGDDITGESGECDILFNPSLWRLYYDDFQYAVMLYMWLSDENNARQVNFGQIAQLDPKEVGSDLTNFAKKSLDGVSNAGAARDAIMFVGGKPNGQLRDVGDIRKAMQVGSRPFGGARVQGNATGVDKVNHDFTSAFNSLDDKAKRQVMNSIIGNEDVVSTLASMGIRLAR